MLTRPAHPAAAASFISSMVATFFVLPANMPMKLSMLPVGRAALSADEALPDRRRTFFTVFLLLSTMQNPMFVG